MAKFTEYLNEAGDKFERQEMGLINNINESISANEGKPIKVKFVGGVIIKNVIGAVKYPDKTSKGKEPLIDVTVKVKGGKDVQLSLKSDGGAPSLAGGGFAGLMDIAPEIVKKFTLAARKGILKKKVKDGENFPDVYQEIPKDKIEEIIAGNVKTGGPIDYVYFGPMDVKGEFKNGTLTVNGELETPKDMSAKKKFFFRLRKRRIDQTFNSEIKPDGFARLVNKSPSKGDANYRIMVTDSTPKEGLTV